MFQVGDKISHPMHGAGVIEDIVEVKLDGVRRKYYVLDLPGKTMTVKVPVDGCGNIGVRSIVTSDMAEEVLNSLDRADTVEPSNWNKRYRENMERIKSGDLFAVASVVKRLIQRDTTCGLSTGERKMLGTAKQILISEIVLAVGSTYEEIEARINCGCIV